MSRPRLHLDADTSTRMLLRMLLERGHDVTRTPTEWMPLDASDEAQLLGALAHGRCIFTFNVRDFTILAREHTQHAGIIVAYQPNWALPELVAALDRLLNTTTAEEWRGMVRWLNDWRR